MRPRSRPPLPATTMLGRKRSIVGLGAPLAVRREFSLARLAAGEPHVGESDALGRPAEVH